MTGGPGACRPGEAEEWARTKVVTPGAHWDTMESSLPSAAWMMRLGEGAMPTGEAEMGIYCPAVPAPRAAQAT